MLHIHHAVKVKSSVLSTDGEPALDSGPFSSRIQRTSVQGGRSRPPWRRDWSAEHGRPHEPVRASYHVTGELLCLGGGLRGDDTGPLDTNDRGGQMSIRYIFLKFSTKHIGDYLISWQNHHLGTSTLLDCHIENPRISESYCIYRTIIRPSKYIIDSLECCKCSIELHKNIGAKIVNELE